MIVITAPTGDIGHQVLDNVLDGAEPVRVIVRDPESLPALIRDRVDVVEGSHGDPDVVDRAFEGADTVFWLLPPNPKAQSVEEAYVEFSRPAAEALTRHQVKRVVTVSALGRGVVTEDAGFVTGSLAMEDLFADTGVALRVLTMPSFMDNLTAQSAAIRKGAFYSPIAGDLRLPSVATRDIAAVAARYLLDPSWTGQESVAVLGPEDISFDDMAEVLTDVLGWPVRFQQISPEAYKATFTGFGMSDAMAQGMLDMALAKNHGIDLSVPRTPENSTPTTFRQWAEEVLKPEIDKQGDPS